MRLAVAALLLLSFQEKGPPLIERRCDAAVVETGTWCRTCDGPAAGGAHEGHDLCPATLCVRKVYTNGCCVRTEPGGG